MPIPPERYNNDGSLKPFTKAEIKAMKIRSRGIADGSSPTYSANRNLENVRLKYFCAPDQLNNMMILFLGAVDTFTGADDRDHLTRLMPFAPFLDKPKLVCAALDSAMGFAFDEDNLEGDVPIPGYKETDTVWDFQSVPYELDKDDTSKDDESYRYLESIPSILETVYITLPGAAAMAYRPQGGGVGDGVPVPFNVGLPRITGTISRRFHRVPKKCWQPGALLYERVWGKPDAGVRGLVGTINKDDGFLGYGAGQLLLIGVKEEPIHDAIANDRAWDLVFDWKVDTRGHNYMPMYLPGPPPTAKWAFVGNDGAYHSAASLNDGVSVFDARNHGGADGVFAIG